MAGVPVTRGARPAAVDHRAAAGGRRVPHDERPSTTRVVATCAVTTGAAPASCSLQPTGVGLLPAARDRQGPRAATRSAPRRGLYATGDAGETSWGDSDTHSRRARARPEELRGRADRARAREVARSSRPRRSSPSSAAGVYSRAPRHALRPDADGGRAHHRRSAAERLRLACCSCTAAARRRRRGSAPRTWARPRSALGYAALPVDPEARRLAVEAQAEQDRAIAPAKRSTSTST